MKLIDFLIKTDKVNKIRITGTMEDIIEWLNQEVGNPEKISNMILMERAEHVESHKAIGEIPKVEQPLNVRTVLLGEKTHENTIEPTEKKRTPEQQAKIDAIKAAYLEKTGRSKKEYTDEDIIRMREEEKLSYAKMANKLGCCIQTAVNRYNRAKKEVGK